MGRPIAANGQNTVFGWFLPIAPQHPELEEDQPPGWRTLGGSFDTKRKFGQGGLKRFRPTSSEVGYRIQISIDGVAE